MDNVLKYSGIALNGLIFVFSVCLLYFVFVYYPNVVKNVRFELPIGQLFAKEVVVDASAFPVISDNFRIDYEEASGLYYVHAAGETVEKFVVNKQAAELSLKNALQTDTLCGQKIIYTAPSSLKGADQYKTTSGC